ncbi:hypothetical protein BT63DRAFT_429298 [Microthyrium microscopicum]|uniref:Kinetochore protein mis14 n=1 Tax=Microthyrium microscopicum TaxID=703497 RepID=A0A6A6TZD5_9PEZI|nr:hypothetical protein BT63DRAFT_429298 [Microthyrium microscopicum]
MPPTTHIPTSQDPSTSNYRKIELQSPHDWTHLRTLGSAAAQTRLATAFPNSDTDDELRARVDALLQTFLATTYQSARANVAVNGVDMTFAENEMDGGQGQEEEEIEPLDAGVADKLRELERKKERLLLKVAGYRRTGPEAAAQRFREEWEGSGSAEERGEETDGGAEDGDIKTEDAEQPALDLVGELRRWDEVQSTYARGVQGLVELKTGMAGTIGQLEEAKTVGDELDGRQR